MSSGSHADSGRQRRSIGMCFLRAGAILVVGACLAVLFLPSVSATPAPEEPRHGLNNETFHTLWSNTSNGAYPNSNTTIEELRNRTDVSFQNPPKAVNRWNKNEYDRFPKTGKKVSVAPTGATQKNSPSTEGPHQNGWIKDAYVEIFSVTPLTKTLRNDTETTNYTTDNGTLIAHTDYRYEPPPPPYSRTIGSGCSATRISWYGESHGISDISVSHSGYNTTNSTIVADYTLSPGASDLLVTVEVTAQITKKTESKVCPDESPSYWATTDVTTYTDSVTVRDRQAVTPHSGRVTMARSNLSAGTTEFYTLRFTPWRGISLPSGDRVVGNWRFYTARDPAWDGLDVTANSGTVPNLSLPSRPPAQPLQTIAFPYRYGPIANGPDGGLTQKLELRNYSGTERNSPTLPANVSVEPSNGSYIQANLISFRTTGGTPANITTSGLVTNTSNTLPLHSIFNAPRVNTTLNTTIKNTSSSSTVFSVRLTAGGAPVHTAPTSGHLLVNGREVDTNESGEALVAVTRTPATVKYVPRPFHEVTPFMGHEPATTTVTPRPSIPGVVAVLNGLFRFVLLTGLFFMPLFILDRIVDADVWPPWKGVWRELF